MDRLVSHILNFVTAQGVVEKDKQEQDFYRYGIEITLSSLLNVVLVLLLGIVTGHVIEAVIFFSAFIFLRSYMGGYHADTYFRCNLLMCISFVGLLFLYVSYQSYINAIVAGVLSVVMFPQILIFCPVENANKPIANEKRGKLKLISCLLYWLFSSASVILIGYHVTLGVMLLFTVLYIALLTTAAKIKNKILKRGAVYEIVEEKDSRSN